MKKRALKSCLQNGIEQRSTVRCFILLVYRKWKRSSMEFDTKESYGTAQKNLYETCWKAIVKCLIVPHDKYLEKELISWNSHTAD